MCVGGGGGGGQSPRMLLLSRHCAAPAFPFLHLHIDLLVSEEECTEQGCVWVP